MPRTHDDATREILATLDIAAEYRALGVEITGREPNAAGWLACRAVGREDVNPSAAINVQSGYYVDLGGNGTTLSLWDFATQHDNGTHIDWKAARKHYAGKANVTLARGRSVKNPNQEIVPQFWNETLAAIWCQTKPPVTVESLRAAGGILARYPAKHQTHPVIAVPVFGPQLVEADPIGWVVWHAGGRPLPVWGKGGEVVRTVKMKTVAGSQSGLMGRHALAVLAVDPTPKTIWKVEGPTDLMAAWSIIPPEKRSTDLVVCNSGGANENIRPEICEIFTGHRVFVLHDADRPGEAGAAKWVESLGRVASEVKQVRLPYPIEDSRGKDLREWTVEEKNDYAALVHLSITQPGGLSSSVPPSAADQGSNFAVSSPGHDAPAAEGSVPATATTENTDGEYERRTVDALFLDVLGETPSGSVMVFASHPSRRRTTEIRDPHKLTYAQLLQISGAPARDNLTESGEESYGRITVSAARNAICYLAGQRQLTDHTLAESGCWAILGKSGNQESGVVLVGAGEAAIWDADAAQLNQVCVPRAGGRLLSLSGSEAWYNFDQLAADLDHAADPKWCESVIAESLDIWDRWAWRNDGAPLVLTGLVLATWVQTLWDWRPQVAITGATKTGKSVLFETLAGIFGRLAIRSSKSTEAGIRQRVGTSARVILADEFESSKHRASVLEMIRASSRGDEVLRGTTSQRGRTFALRHICYVAAVDIGLRRAPDQNRFIQLKLVLPPKHLHGKLCTPPADILHDLGQRLLAIAVRYISAAGPLAASLKAVAIEGADSRAIESYAVPAAIWATACRFSSADSAGLLRQMVQTTTESTGDNDDEANDERELLQAIGASEMRLDRGVSCTVSEALSNRGTDFLDGLARYGLAIVEGGRRGPRSDRHLAEDSEFLFLDPRTVERRLLCGTRWADQATDTHLLRLDGAFKTRRWIGKRRPYGVAVPMRIIIPEIAEDGAAEFLSQGDNRGTTEG